MLDKTGREKKTPMERM